MCGIFGCSWGTRSKRSISPIVPRMLIYMNQERGRDSVGLSFVGEKDDKSGEEFKVYKALGDPRDFLTRHSIEFEAFHSRVLMGHCRAASQGTATGSLDSVHPFQYGNILGAHNGYISNWRLLLDDTGDDKRSIDIDSKLLIWRIANRPIEHAFEDLCGKIACWWIDVRDTSSMYFYTWDKELTITRSGVMPFIFSSDKKHVQQLGAKEDSIMEVDSTVGQVIKVNLRTCEHENIGEYPAKKQSAILAIVSSSYDRNVERYSNLKSRFGSGMFKLGHSHVNSARTFTHSSQLDGWTPGYEMKTDEESDNAYVDIADAIFQEDELTQCWTCKKLYRSISGVHGMFSRTCDDCGERGITTTTQEGTIILEWACAKMSLYALQFYRESVVADDELSKPFSRKSRLMAIIDKEIDAKKRLMGLTIP